MKASLETTLHVDEQPLIAEVQPTIETTLAHVNVRSKAVIADTQAEVMAEHPGRSGPQVGPIAVDTLIANPEHLAGGVELYVGRHRPVTPETEHWQWCRNGIRFSCEGRRLLDRPRRSVDGERSIAGQLQPQIIEVYSGDGHDLVVLPAEKCEFIGQLVYLELGLRGHLSARDEGVVSPCEILIDGSECAGHHRRNN